MNFSKALEEIKAGAVMFRSGWNGSGMFVFLVGGSNFKVSRPPLSTIFEEGTDITYRPHIDMRASDGTIGVWNPSMSDIMADDWVVA